MLQKEDLVYYRILQKHMFIINTFEAMNVKKTFQLFNNKFAAEIRTAGYGKELQTNTWEATANFTEHMTNIIDASNS